MFLNTLAQDNTNQHSQDKYQHSGESISLYFHYVPSEVLLACAIFAPVVPSFKDILPVIREDAKYMLILRLD